MNNSYQVKEIFGPTLQGEGPHAGWPCLFLRLSGCNAWDGRAETRASSACPYCDTDFRGGERLTLKHILDRLGALRQHHQDLGLVLTGGEPLLQADAALIEALCGQFPWVDVETNGTRPCPAHPENLCVVCSPKAVNDSNICVRANAWKILIPHQERFLGPAEASGLPMWVQPVCPDSGPQGAAYQAHLQRCIQLCLERGYRLSLQQHKILGLP